jgi:hypothetical protein
MELIYGMYFLREIGGLGALLNESLVIYNLCPAKIRSRKLKKLS